MTVDDEWTLAAEPTIVRAPPPPPPRMSPPRMSPSTVGAAAPRNEERPSYGTVPRADRPPPDDTIVASTPYAFHATAAVQMAEMMDGSATIVTNEPHYHEDPHAGAATGEVSGVQERVAGIAPLFDSVKLNKLIVSSYKVMGFAVLLTILLGLASFIATNLFYMINESWVTPMQLSSTDPRVLQLTQQYSASKAARDGVATQKLEFESRLMDSTRIMASEGKFQAAFDEAMKADLQDRTGQLEAFRKLIGNLQRTRRDVSAANRAYTSISKDQLKREFAAGLIDRDAQVKGGYELAEIQGANLGLHEKNVEIDARVMDLQRQVASLQTAGAHGDGAMSYEILHMRHEYEQSVLTSKKAADDIDALTKSVAMFDKTLADYDVQLARIAKAPYVQAADKSVSTAFVPYDNVSAVQVGDKVYKCSVGFLFCSKVGKVAEVLDGEILGKHPFHNRELRGVLIRLELTDSKAIEKPVLHLGHAPLGI